MSVDCLEIVWTQSCLELSGDGQKRSNRFTLLSMMSVDRRPVLAPPRRRPRAEMRKAGVIIDDVAC